jgi:hypothetical protein
VPGGHQPARRKSLGVRSLAVRAATEGTPTGSWLARNLETAARVRHGLALRRLRGLAASRDLAVAAYRQPCRAQPRASCAACRCKRIGRSDSWRERIQSRLRGVCGTSRPSPWHWNRSLDAITALVERIGCDGRMRHVRNRTYFERRFRNALSRYGFLLSGEGGWTVTWSCKSTRVHTPTRPV